MSKKGSRGLTSCEKGWVQHHTHTHTQQLTQGNGLTQNTEHQHCLDQVKKTFLVRYGCSRDLSLEKRGAYRLHSGRDRRGRTRERKESGGKRERKESGGKRVRKESGGKGAGEITLK